MGLRNGAMSIGPSLPDLERYSAARCGGHTWAAYSSTADNNGIILFWHVNSSLYERNQLFRKLWNYFVYLFMEKTLASRCTNPGVSGLFCCDGCDDKSSRKKGFVRRARTQVKIIPLFHTHACYFTADNLMISLISKVTSGLHRKVVNLL